MIQPRAAAPPETPLAVFQPIEPEIDSASTCTHIFTRAYTEPVGWKRQQHSPQKAELPSLDGTVLVLDTETVKHQLTFGVAEIYQEQRCKERVVFCRDDLQTTDPVAYERLKEICNALDMGPRPRIQLVNCAWLFQNAIWPARKHGWIIAGHNIVYDFSRLADSWEKATKSARQGARFCNGFAFKRHFTTKGGLQTPVFCRIKRDDRHHVRYDMKKAVVIDTQSADFTYTDRNHSLKNACRTWGIPFEERPGFHSGEITLDNVKGCLYDVQKTAELLWVVNAEHNTYSHRAHLSRMQSGAALAKSDLDAMGVRPRLDVQPDFPKPRLGQAATTYFGGWVEASIGGVLPVEYLDFLSMFVTSHAVLRLWWKQYTAARLVVEEIPPEEITALLARIRDNPDLLFTPETHNELDFFALVHPNGATLPSRVTIPSRGVSKRERLTYDAAQIYEEASIAQAPYWGALDAHGGKIVPDMRYEARRKRWRVDGEFDDLPRALLRRNQQRPPSGKAHGNIDEIAQHVRDTLGDQNVTTSDVLDFFTSHERPTLSWARARAREYSADDENAISAATDSVITIGPVFSQCPLWCAGPDLAHAAMTGGTPQVLQAWRLRPEGGQLDTLTPLRFRGDDPIDPRTDDFFVKLIELRVRKSDDPLGDKRRKTGYKVVALSGAYGISAETNPMDVDPDDETRKLRRVTVYADTVFNDSIDRPERPGRFNFFPTAALVTAEARLLLALGKHEVERRGGAIAYCDTDSLAVVATEHGGFVPCEGGPYLLPDGTRAVRALPWKEVEAVRERFAALNPYDAAAVPDSILKCEDENYALDADGNADYSRREQLWCYAVSEKLYALFTIDVRGEPHVRKYSSLVLGQFRSPVPVPPDGDPHAWIVDAWTREIRAALGKPVAPFAWEAYPAMEQLTMTTWNVFKHYQSYARPFDFLIVGIISRDLKDIAACPQYCCKEPRPSCLLFDDAAQWRAQEWRCLRCGAPWDFDTFPRLRTYGELVERTLQKVERRRLNADGSEPSSVMRGVTVPRPVRVESKTAIGKEVIVDPTDTGEGFTAEQLSATPVQEYHNPNDRLDALRAKIKATGIKAIARASGVSRSKLQAFVNQGAMPQRSTIKNLEAALDRLECT